jgi:hypothetical protein
MVLGHTGVVALNSTDVLAPGAIRAGIGAIFATGNGGNRVDLLLDDDASRDRGMTARASLAVGIPGAIEAALTVPYSNNETGNVSTDGLGDVTVSAKLRLWAQRGWRPATAVSVSWIPETARKPEVRSVTTNGYLATMSTQLGLITGDWTWTILGELGGFWRDPGRAESDASFIYGLAGVVPLTRTGLVEDTGELQLIAEVNGSSARRSLAHEPDDAVSFAPGFRYLAPSWGVTVTGVFTSYERPTKNAGSGGMMTFHAVF